MRRAGLAPVLPAALLLALAAGPARAEGPVEGGGEDGLEEIQKIAIRISKSLKENEEALAALARGEKGAPKPVHIHLPGGT